MLNEINIQYLTEGTDIMVENHHVYLDAIVYSGFSSSCHVGECENCPCTANLKGNMAKASDEHRMNEVRFEIWL